VPQVTGELEAAKLVINSSIAFRYLLYLTGGLERKTLSRS